MRLHVLLLIAASALQARAASIPDNVRALPVAEIENEADGKIVTEETLGNDIIEPLNTVNELGNELRTQKVDEIPVKVVTDTKTVITSDVPENNVVNDVPKEDKPEEDNKKPSESNIADLSEFGDDDPETQPESPSLSLLFIKDALDSAHQSIQLSVNSFSQTFHTWIKDQSSLLPPDVQISNVKAIVENNISKLNKTIQGYFNPEQAVKLIELPDDSVNHVEVVETDLKNLEKNFENEVKSVLGSVRADNSTSSSTTNSSSNFPPVFQNIQQVIQQGFNNISTSLQNLFNPNSDGNNSSLNNIWTQFGQNIGNFFNQGNPPQGAQSDDSSTPRPSIFQSIQTIFGNPQQNIQKPQSDQQQPNRPIINAIQSNPLVQGISGVFNRQPTKSPNNPQAVTPAAEPAKIPEEGSNVVPVKPEHNVAAVEQVQAASTENEQKEKPVEFVPPAGPIKQAIQNSPIVQGIAETVQKIQSVVTNPEKPRKLGFIHGLHGGHGGHGGNDDRVTADVDSISASDVNPSEDDSKKPEECHKKIVEKASAVENNERKVVVPEVKVADKTD